MQDNYKRGKWLALCQRCGNKHLNSQLKLEWTNLRVCNDCFEYRNPQDFVKPVLERGSTPWSRLASEVSVDPFDYVDAGYWDSPAIVETGSGATATSDRYTELG